MLVVHQKSLIHLPENFDRMQLFLVLAVWSIIRERWTVNARLVRVEIFFRFHQRYTTKHLYTLYNLSHVIVHLDSVPPVPVDKTRCTAKPDCNPPGYLPSCLLITVNWSVNCFACVQRSTCTSCRTPPSTECHANPQFCGQKPIKTNKNWLPRQRPSRD